MIVLNSEALLREARTRASNVGINLVFEEENHPRTDGKNMYVQEPDGSWTEDQWASWWGSYEHELGHNIEAMTDVFKTMRDNDLDMSSFLGNVLNVLDDHRQEHHNHTEYLGRRLRLEVSHTLYAQRLVDSPEFGKSTSAKRAALTAIVAWDTLCREDWMPSLAGMGNKLISKLTPVYQDVVSLMLRREYGNTLKSGIDADTEYKLAVEIASLFPDAEEEEKEKKEEEEKEKKAGDESEGDEQADEEAIRKLFKHKHGDPNGYPSDVEVEKDTGPYGMTYTPRRLSDHEVWYKPKAVPSARAVDRILDGVVGHTLHKTLLKRIQCAKVTKYQHSLKRGKLSSKSLYKAGVRKDSPKVFKKKCTQITVDAAFTILVDQSGSMYSRNKGIHAASCVLMLNQALSALNIPTELIGFDEGEEAPRAAVWKTFNKSISNQDLVGFMADSIRSQYANNADGESILWAHQRLVKQKAKRKILLVLSDGSPEGFHPGNLHWYTQMVTASIEKKSPVELYGIGILSTAVEKYYSKHVVLNDTGDLENAMLNVLEQTLFNS